MTKFSFGALLINAFYEAVRTVKLIEISDVTPDLDGKGHSRGLYAQCMRGVGRKSSRKSAVVAGNDGQQFSIDRVATLL